MGTQGSGGGGGFWCYDGDEFGSPGSNVYLLDLWEGENIPLGGPNLTIPRSKESVQVQIDRAVEKLRQFDSDLPEKIKKIATDLFNNKIPTTTHVELPFPDDALTKYKKRDCEPIGLMYYDGTIGKLVYEKKHFDKLKDNTEIAATMFHEAWYKLIRDQVKHDYSESVTNSIMTRKLTVCLFSTSTTCLDEAKRESNPEDHFTGFKPREKICSSSKSKVTFVSSWDLFDTFFLKIEKLVDRSFLPFYRTAKMNFEVFSDSIYYYNLGLKHFDLHLAADLPRIAISENSKKYSLPLERVFVGESPKFLLSHPVYLLIYDPSVSLDQIKKNVVRPIDSLTCE